MQNVSSFSQPKSSASIPKFYPSRPSLLYPHKNLLHPDESSLTPFLAPAVFSSLIPSLVKLEIPRLYTRTARSEVP
ncbi:unnamed protein product [Allacma fusca]|uniref:Uncharacterized protein n=1 Tax=Allacma fusca TaxID=39272 RepID=A0A8J2KXF8_9HEXA|nr:unnamed protein product [Allacma fusca]